MGHGFYFTGDHSAFGVISLDTDGARRYATIALNSGSQPTGTRRVEWVGRPGSPTCRCQRANPTAPATPALTTTGTRRWAW